MKPTIESQTGSASQRNPLKSMKWIFKPKPSPKTLKALEPLRGSFDHIRERLNTVKITKAISGEITDKNYGVVRLAFDVGIVYEIEGIAQTQKHRKGWKSGNPQKMGFGGQLAFSHYLTFFADVSNFTVKECRFQASPKPKPYDFLFRIPHTNGSRLFFKIEVKTAPCGQSRVNYYKSFGTPYPDYAVIVKCLNEEMTKYEIYGYASGTYIKAQKSSIRNNRMCHSIQLHRRKFNYYSFFHTNFLGLPFIEKFGD